VTFQAIGKALLVLAAAGCAAPRPGERGLLGPLTAERLAWAAEEAGFRVVDLKADLPRAARSSLPFATLPVEDPRLEELRKKYPLEKAIEGARDEWTAQLRLKEWVWKAIPGGNPRVRATRAMEILDHASRGETFYCTHYAITYVEAALALGWQARKIAVDRKHGPEGLGSSHHGVAEVWSNQHRKWVVIDPQSNLHFEARGVPLSAWEIRAEWLRDRGASVEHVVGVPPKAVRKNPAIVWWDRAGEDETAAYFWLYIVDNVVAEGAGTKLIFPQDAANEGEIWYQNSDDRRSRLHTGYLTGRFVPVRRLEDFYWTVGVVEAAVTAVGKGRIEMSLESHLPGRTGYEVSTDGKTWARAPDGPVAWTLKPGLNSLRLHAVGPRGWTGPEAVVLLALEAAR
jgi:hypothetical protein